GKSVVSPPRAPQRAPSAAEPAGELREERHGSDSFDVERAGGSQRCPRPARGSWQAAAYAGATEEILNGRESVSRIWHFSGNGCSVLVGKDLRRPGTYFAAAPPVTAGKPGATHRPLSVAQCERLVGQLVNPGKPPFAQRYVLDLPEGLSVPDLRKSQEPIGVAYDELSANVEVALPVLVAHVTDRRFSYVYEDFVSGVFQCETVGGACARIIAAHVEVYRPAVTKYDEEGRSKSLWFLA